MAQYYSPKCNDEDKLVKSRCQCKKSTKKTVKIKIILSIKRLKNNLLIMLKPQLMSKPQNKMR